MKKEALEAAKAAFMIEAEELTRAGGVMDDEALSKTVDILAKSQRIGASGCGHSGIACQHFAHLMCCIELPTKFIPPSEAVHGGMGFLKKDDVLVLASRGGKTAELIPMMEIAHTKGVIVVVITENLHSPLATGADVVLPMDVKRETDKYNSQGTSSFVVLSAIFDALQAALIEETDYKNEQFALIHPGGAVGDRLNK